MEANLRGLAVGLRRDGETDDEAYQRIKSSRYLIDYRSDEYWPFYHVEHKFGRVILTINTAHPFFSELYEPLMKTDLADAVSEDGHTETAVGNRGPVVALELLLLSLARAQSVMYRENPEAKRVFEAFRRSSSETYRVQLAAVASIVASGCAWSILPMKRRSIPSRHWRLAMSCASCSAKRTATNI